MCLNVRNMPSPTVRLMAPALIGAVTVWCLRQPSFGEGHAPFAQELVAGCGTALLMMWGYQDRMVSNPLIAPLRWCGQRCYSVYLVHWPVTKAIAGLGLWLGILTPVMTIASCFP